jgi:methionyl-tRNA formyltransferase
MTRPTAKPRVVVFGYSDVGVRCLDILLRRGEQVVAVVTHADDPAEEQWFGSVADLARRHGIPVLMPESLRDPAVVAAVCRFEPGLIFSFYYRMMIPARLLERARLGAFNMHGSLLPRYRGRAPVNWAVLHGEVETGATLHHMIARADAGDIVDQERVPIGPEETAGEVARKVTAAACAILERRLEQIREGRAPRVPQDESQATYFGRRRPEDGRIDWLASAARTVNLVRAVTRPFPGAFTATARGRLYVWRARAVPQRVRAAAGTVVGHEPLVVAAADGAVEVVDWSWGEGGADDRPPEIGSRLGSEAPR